MIASRPTHGHLCQETLRDSHKTKARQTMQVDWSVGSATGKLAMHDACDAHGERHAAWRRLAPQRLTVLYSVAHQVCILCIEAGLTSGTLRVLSVQAVMASREFVKFLVMCILTINLKSIFRHLDATLPKFQVRLGISLPAALCSRQHGWL